MDEWKGGIEEVTGQDEEVNGVSGGVRRVEGKAKILMEAMVEIERDLDKAGVWVSATLDFRVEGW